MHYAKTENNRFIQNYTTIMCIFAYRLLPANLVRMFHFSLLSLCLLQVEVRYMTCTLLKTPLNLLSKTTVIHKITLKTRINSLHNYNYE